MLKEPNFVKNAKIKNETFWVIFEQCDNESSTDFVHFFDEYDDTLRKFFLNDITTKYIIATDLVLRPRSSIHESEFIKRLLLMSLSNEVVHQPQQQQHRSWYPSKKFFNETDELAT